MTPLRAIRFAAACLCAAALLLTACGGTTALLSGATADPAVIRPTGRQRTDPIRLSYTVGRPAQVTIRVRPAAGGPDIVLRPAEQVAAGSHFVLFNGVVPTGAAPGETAAPVARVLPNGSYRFLVHVDAGGQQQDSEAAFSVQGAATTPPALENLQIFPATISPNGDAVDDVAQITYRLVDTSTTSVTLQGATGPPVKVLSPLRVPAGEQQLAFNGQNLLGQPVPNGVYTVTVRAEDRAGNAVEARRPLTVTDAGIPSISLVSVKIDPPQIMLGQKIHVRMVVQNTGTVPLRTQGPAPGYTYTTNDSYSSIEGGKYVEEAGYWRVGLDWDGNAGGAPYRYPFRWGFGATLAPGATTTIDGYVTVLKHERTMSFYAGVLQEGVQIVRDQLGRTPINISW